jgi:hypothetical protein
MAGSLRTVAEDISKYKLNLVGVQEARLDRIGTEPASEYSVTDLLKTLLGGGSVDAFHHTRHATIRWKCFVSAHAACARGWVAIT